jgi:hypothetical protein
MKKCNSSLEKKKSLQIYEFKGMTHTERYIRRYEVVQRNQEPTQEWSNSEDRLLPYPQTLD